MRRLPQHPAKTTLPRGVLFWGPFDLAPENDCGVHGALILKVTTSYGYAGSGLSAGRSSCSYNREELLMPATEPRPSVRPPAPALLCLGSASACASAQEHVLVRDCHPKCCCLRHVSANPVAVMLLSPRERVWQTRMTCRKPETKVPP